ncbi:MAG TPA: hypothetical protein VFW90_02505 [Candidatus Saccharimonadales bacterium]|nr:hypothetical protein [Candidatus Saccharimonadales bacterium]
MKNKNLALMVIVAVFAAIISFVVSGAIFGSPQKNPIKVPVVTKISSDFPDVNNDSTYTSFFNQNALDPTQLITIGGSGNDAPFLQANQ